MRLILCTLILELVTGIVYGQISPRHIKTYGPEVTKSGQVINAIASDTNGVMFFGIDKGVLVYDGETWEVISLPGGVGAQSLEYDSIRNRIWVGGLHTFGYLCYDSVVHYRYISLSDTEYLRRHFNQVWGILVGSKSVTFAIEEGIYVVRNDSVRVMDISNAYYFEVDGLSYVSSTRGPLYILHEGKLIPIWDQSEIANQAVYQIVKLDRDNHLLFTPFDGVFVHHLPTKRVFPYLAPLSKLLKKSGYFASTLLSEGVLAIGTYFDGIVITDLHGNVIDQCDQRKGLLSNGISDLELDRFGKLWAATDYGISVIDLVAALPQLPLPPRQKPQTLITAIVVNQDSTIYPSAKLTPLFFGRRPGQLDIRFSTPGSEYLTSRQYLARLDGYDGVWRPATSIGIATYSQLPNGTYTFRVKSKIIGLEESSEASINFTIHEPWYLFIVDAGLYILAAVGLGGLLILAVTVRLRGSRNKLAQLVAKKTAEIELHKQELSAINADLLRVNEELDIFLYRSSHDLIAPIKSIKGLIQLMKASAVDSDKYIQLMEDRIERLERLLIEISMYVKNAKAAPIKSSFGLKDMIREVWSELEFMPEADRTNFEVDVADGLILVCDRKRWKMLITNLVTNSIKYQDKSKSNAFIRVTATEESDGLHLVVEDNGQGIQAEYQPRIFDMFYRASESSSGTGLGLFLVKKIVDGLKGDIRLESTYRAGTKVEITLPAQIERV